MTYESTLGWLRSILSFILVVLFLSVLRRLHTAPEGAICAIAAVILELGLIRTVELLLKRRKAKISTASLS